MSIIGRRIELAKEAVELIKEFGEKPDVELFNIEYEYLKRHGKADKFDRIVRS